MRESERMPDVKPPIKKDTPRNIEDESKKEAGKRDEYGRISSGGVNFGSA